MFKNGARRLIVGVMSVGLLVGGVGIASDISDRPTESPSAQCWTWWAWIPVPVSCDK